jgi:hypothetical protein
LAKTFLSLGGGSRDWNDMMKYMRQWQAAFTEASAFMDTDQVHPDTLWLDQV